MDLKDARFMSFHTRCYRILSIIFKLIMGHHTCGLFIFICNFVLIFMLHTSLFASLTSGSRARHDRIHTFISLYWASSIFPICSILSASSIATRMSQTAAVRVPPPTPLPLPPLFPPSPPSPVSPQPPRPPAPAATTQKPRYHRRCCESLLCILLFHHSIISSFHHSIRPSHPMYFAACLDKVDTMNLLEVERLD